ncbi:MAG: hypothetical protein LBT44_08280, partial [Clostridiales bacterium]|nr:hypothetical protein [Clostridiales bacterium]
DTSLFVAGKAAFSLIRLSQFGIFQDAMADELALTHLPIGQNKALAIQPLQVLAVSQWTQHPDAAALLINFLAADAQAGEALGADSGIPCSPAVRSAIAAASANANQLLYAYYGQAAERMVTPEPSLPNETEFINGLKAIGQSLGAGQSTRVQAAQQLYALIQGLQSTITNELPGRLPGRLPRATA